MFKQDAIRELMKLRDTLKEEKGIEDIRAREMYDYVSKSTVNRLSTNQYIFQNFEKPLDFPMRPREYTKIFNVNDDYDNSYSKYRNGLDEGVSKFIPIKDSLYGIDAHLKEKPAANKPKEKSFKLVLDQSQVVMDTQTKPEDVGTQHEDQEKEEDQHQPINSQRQALQVYTGSEKQLSHRSQQSHETKPIDTQTHQDQISIEEPVQDKSQNKLPSQQKIPSQNHLTVEDKSTQPQQEITKSPRQDLPQGGLLQNLTQQFIKQQFSSQPSALDISKQ